VPTILDRIVAGKHDERPPAAACCARRPRFRRGRHRASAARLSRALGSYSPHGVHLFAEIKRKSRRGPDPADFDPAAIAVFTMPAGPSL
jgi:hypothetical protein